MLKIVTNNLTFNEISDAIGFEVSGRAPYG